MYRLHILLTLMLSNSIKHCLPRSVHGSSFAAFLSCSGHSLVMCFILVFVSILFILFHLLLLADLSNFSRQRGEDKKRALLSYLTWSMRWNPACVYVAKYFVSQVTSFFMPPDSTNPCLLDLNSFGTTSLHKVSPLCAVCYFYQSLRLCLSHHMWHCITHVCSCCKLSFLAFHDCSCKRKASQKLITMALSTHLSPFFSARASKDRIAVCFDAPLSPFLPCMK